MCATLSIFIEPDSMAEGSLKGMSAIADVLPLGGKSSRLRPVTGLVVALDEPDEPTKTKLPPGEWLVRATLPSGEVLEQEFSLKESPIEVRLRSEALVPANLSFESATGLLPVTATNSTLAALLKQTAEIQQRLTFVTQDILKSTGLAAQTASKVSSAAEKLSRRTSLPDLSTLYFQRVPSKATGKNSFAFKGASAAIANFGTITNRPFKDLENLIKNTPPRESAPPLSTVIAEIDSRALRNDFTITSTFSADSAAPLLFGRLSSVSTVELQGEDSLQTALIDLPDDTEEFVNPGAQRNGKVRRVFSWLHTDQPSNRILIACIPHVWIVQLTRRQADVRILLSGLSDEAQAPQMKLAVHDPTVASVLGFLQKGDLDSAKLLATESIRMLDQKRINPYAAAAAAYVLVHVQNDEQSYWQHWVRNLARWFPAIPDGTILLATLRLQRGDFGFSSVDQRLTIAQQRRLFNEAKDLVLQSLGHGPPIFRMGIKLLTENIDILRNMASDLNEPADDLANAAALVRWMRLRVDTSQPFTVFSI